MKNIKLLQEFEESLSPKETIHPADAFLARKRKELEERQQAELDAIKFPDEKPKSALQPSTAFDEPKQLEEFTDAEMEGYTSSEAYQELLKLQKENEPNYEAMPQGMKEAQQRNGVRDHGITGGFEWADKSQTAVKFVENEKGTVYLSDPNILTPQVKSVIDRNFNGSPYVGDGKSIVITPEVEVNEFDIEEETEQVDLFAKTELTFTAPKEVINEALKTQIEWKPAEDISFDGSKLHLSHIDEVGMMDNNPYPKAYIGVDPGKKGGIVALTQNGIIGKWVIPLLGDNVDGNGIWLILSSLKEKYNCTLVLEDVHSLFGMSASTNFSMGHTLGILDGIIAVSKIRLIRISPKNWQKSIWENKDMVYKPIKPDQKRASVDTKASSINAAYRLYPNVDFRATTRSKNPWDGLTDACCLAEYGRRNNL